jgi:sRNA-binding carbon storage regulator CsrA
MTSFAVNAPKELETRRKELRARLRGAAGAPAAPTFTKQEMRDAAARLMSTVLKSRTIQ